MFEHRGQPVIGRAAFFMRQLRAVCLAGLIAAVSLLGGAAGYHWLAGLAWVDALLNAAMILTGMGPVDTLPNDAAKLFATFYALYSGVAFLTIMAVFLAPLVHRLLHRLHMDRDGDDAGQDTPDR
ncbi:MAG: hypothetical protein JNM31_04805 [Flavobacteriales bacterium]|nr:hypothetical protein [Flavobacteriales bacterium]